MHKHETNRTARTETVDASPRDAKTLPVPEAGRLYFDLGRNASYEAAKRGDLPVIRIGSRLRVPVAALERMLADAGRKRDIGRGNG
jgi:hypothetical protein